MALIGLLVARWERPKGDRPGRAEHAVVLFVAVFIFHMACRAFAETVGGYGHELTNVFPVAPTALVTIAIRFFMGRFKPPLSFALALREGYQRGCGRGEAPYRWEGRD